MFRDHFLRCATLLFVFCAVSLLLWPRSAAADPTDVETINVNFSMACITPNTCGSSTFTFVGSFSFDPDTNSIVGPWSFSTPLGTISSTDPFASTVTDSVAAPGFDVLSFDDTLDSNGSPTSSMVTGDLNIGFQLVYVDSQVGGTLVPIASNYPTDFVSCTLTIAGSTSNCDYSNATTFGLQANAPTPTPEPSSLFLLGTGLLGLGLLIRPKILGAQSR